jgi:hypothetical protein
MGAVENGEVVLKSPSRLSSVSLQVKPLLGFPGLWPTATMTPSIRFFGYAEGLGSCGVTSDHRPDHKRVRMRA